MNENVNSDVRMIWDDGCTLLTTLRRRVLSVVVNTRINKSRRVLIAISIVENINKLFIVCARYHKVSCYHNKIYYPYEKTNYIRTNHTCKVPHTYWWSYQCDKAYQVGIVLKFRVNLWCISINSEQRIMCLCLQRRKPNTIKVNRK